VIQFNLVSKITIQYSVETQIIRLHDEHTDLPINLHKRKLPRKKIHFPYFSFFNITILAATKSKSLGLI